MKPLFPRAMALATTVLLVAAPGALAAKRTHRHHAAGGAIPSHRPVSPLHAAVVPGLSAKVDSHGMAHPPARAPQSVKRAIWAGNQLQHKPYVWGGGHGAWKARGYDCSGSVSYVLHAGGLLGTPLVSGALARWGARGRGRWITIYANAGHAFVYLAGLRLDTAGTGESGPRWQTEPRWSMSGFAARHPRGL